MIKERRNYPKASLEGEALLAIAESIHKAQLMGIAPAGVQVECERQVVETLAQKKSEAGLYPDFDLIFNLPTDDTTISAHCTVSNCRRLSQDRYHLVLGFEQICHDDDVKVNQFLGLLTSH